MTRRSLNAMMRKAPEKRIVSRQGWGAPLRQPKPGECKQPAMETGKSRMETLIQPDHDVNVEMEKPSP